MASTWAPDEALFRLSIANLAATAPVSPEEEKRLIAEMIAGKRAYKQLSKDKNLDFAERERLCQVSERGLEARKTLIQSNGRLVISIASKYSGHGLSLAELSQEGVLGLIRAIDKFDVTKGVRLSTYASYWIRQSVSRAVAVQTRVIRLPVHKVDHLGKIKKAMGQLTQTLGRTPELEEIAALTGDEPAQIYELLQDGQDTLSLEEPVGEDGATLADFVENDLTQDLEDQVDSTLLETEIRRALAGLSARESRIVELRYGLRDGQPLTLQDVAERFGLTRERIRQIEKEALAKLRQPHHANRLIGFVN
ncbi:MAG: sigma-70 family RNA polymerase sigma factor [Anaerolineaceae bacterium]|nr:sigma-70 family RNA polymerase sigma factor [Anaerolineaceae bacterium]